jgi:hypothetical protein
VLSAEDPTDCRQATTTSLNELVVEVYLAAWTRAAVEDEQRRRTISEADDMNGDEPGGVPIDFDPLLRTARAREIAARWRRSFRVARRALSQGHLISVAGLDRLCSRAEPVVDVGSTGRAGLVRTVNPGVEGDPGRATNAPRELSSRRPPPPIVADLRTLRRWPGDEPQHCQRRPSPLTGRDGRRPLCGSPRREHVGSVWYTRGPYLASGSLNYQKGGWCVAF